MSFNDSYIKRIDDSVDDEFQRMLVHPSSSVGYNAMMWLLFAFAVAAIWIIPTPEVFSLTVAMFCIPAASLLVSYAWLRKRMPTPRVMKLTWQEILTLGVVLVMWGIGSARVHSDGSVSETLGFATGSLVGALVGLGIAVLFLKVIMPAIRNRDQRRLDDALEDD